MAIVLSNDSPSYVGIASELERLLTGQDYALYDLGTDLSSAKGVFDEIDARQAPFVVAIGLHAARLAREFSSAPMIFCQVFNYQSHDLVSDRGRGVAAIPPLDRQLQTWQQLDPGLASIGAIVGEGHEELIEEALRVTGNAAVDLHYRIAHSDRETLYLFKRLIPSINGFWLFPDNRVLSPAVIEQIFAYAARHRIQMTVFNPSLLKLGALMSASSTHTDIALTVLEVLERMHSGKTNSVAPLTPLSEMDIHFNDAVVERFGLGEPIGEAPLLTTR